MGEDFEVDVCPKCGSHNVNTWWGEFGITRIFLHCLACNYIEVKNSKLFNEPEPEPEPDPEPQQEQDNDERQPWQTDPDSWKQDD